MFFLLIFIAKTLQLKVAQWFFWQINRNLESSIFVTVTGNKWSNIISLQIISNTFRLKLYPAVHKSTLSVHRSAGHGNSGALVSKDSRSARDFRRENPKLCEIVFGRVSRAYGRCAVNSAQRVAE